jgi:phage-related protein
MMDFCMPYLIQVMREYTSKIDTLVLAAQALEAKHVSKIFLFFVVLLNICFLIFHLNSLNFLSHLS